MSEERNRRPRQNLKSKDYSAHTVVFVSAGQVLANRYKLVREIARGGMGIVFEAIDTKLDDLKVAIKVLPPELASSVKSRNRLRKEAIAAIKVTHPNIVRLHGFEEDGTTSFLLMEYLDGKSLEDATAESETLPLDEVLQVAKDICPALDYAHANNIIHRDIKPANLMYQLQGDTRTTKITDFGIAYTIKDSMTRLTGIESAGTLMYIAPEQLKGERPDARSDQYSLAASLYELLSGDPPFVGGGLSHQVLNAKPKKIDDLPARVNAALLKALSKKPEDRFENCTDFLAHLEGGKSTALEPNKESDEDSNYQKQSYAIAICTAVFLAIFGVNGLFQSEPRREPVHKPIVKTAALISAPSLPLKQKEIVSQPLVRKVKEVQKIVAPSPLEFSINSDPAGTKVFCYELPKRYLGKTPLSRTFMPGTYNLKFVRPGYDTVTKTVQIQSNAPAALTVQLKASLGSVNLSVDPRSAHIFINDELISETMRTGYELQPGTYTVRAQLDGYKTSTRRLKIQGGKTSHLRMSLQKKAALLSISVTPSDANIMVNGANVDVLSAMYMMKEPGHYSIVVSKAGYKAQSKEVSLSAGDRETIDFTLEEVEPIPVNLKVSLLRYRDEKVTYVSSITLDGEEVRNYSLDKDRWHNRGSNIRKRTYNIQTELKPGVYTLSFSGTLSLSGFLSSQPDQDFRVEKTVTISEHQSNYTVDLGHVSYEYSETEGNEDSSTSSNSADWVDLIPLLLKK